MVYIIVNIKSIHIRGHIYLHFIPKLILYETGYCWENVGFVKICKAVSVSAV